MAVAYVGLGSNLGDRRATLEGAVAELGRTPGVRVLRLSAFRETDPLGGPAQPRYLNVVAEVETSLPPRALLDRLLEIEACFGRMRRERWGPRTLDLDLLLHADSVIDEPGLVVPHARIAERAFVLVPLCELIPEGRHPVTSRTFSELLAALTTGVLR